MHQYTDELVAVKSLKGNYMIIERHLLNKINILYRIH